MKVLHLISGGDTGGARTHVHLLLRHLNTEHEATLVCFMRGPFSRDAEALGIPTVIIEKPLLGALRELRRLVARTGAELIHCHGSRGNLMGALLKPLVRLPVISTIHSDPRIDYMGRPMARLIYGTLNYLALHRMDFYVGVSDAMRELLISRGYDANRIFVIYNGVDFEEIPPAVPGERERYFAKVGLQADADSVVVGIGARLDPVKDIPTLLRGFALAWRSHPNMRLLIAGEGPERENLDALARELGIADVVCFAGWQTDMPLFYRCIDINTLTSLSETFSYAVTEGARERDVVVSSRVGGLPKLIEPGKNGYLFEPGDWEALGAHLSRLAEDPALRRRLGDALYEKVRREYSAAATAQVQVGIYRRVLEMRKQTRTGVLICGAYGMHNAGDEAVLDAILADMRALDPEMPVTVMSRDPRETRVLHAVHAFHTFNVPAFWRYARRSLLYINGGGSLIQDITSSRSLWYYLYTLAAARKRGCRVMMYGCGIGPVRHGLNRRLAGRVISRNVDAVTLREACSLEVLRELGVDGPEVRVASEPALSLAPAPKPEIDAIYRAEGLERERPYFCICIRRWPAIRQKLPLLAAAADYAFRRYGLYPLLLTVNHQQDDESARRLREEIQAPCVLLRTPMQSGALIGFLGRMRLVMAMRLHPLIFSTSQSVPSVGISYDPKVSAFLDYIGQKNCIDYTDLKSPEQLFPLLDAAMAEDPAALREATARIREVERRNADTARQLLEAEGWKPGTGLAAPWAAERGPDTGGAPPEVEG